MAKKKGQLTSDNIKSVQIVATLDDGSHIIGVFDDRILIKYIVASCKFAKLREELFGQCSLKELVE